MKNMITSIALAMGAFFGVGGHQAEVYKAMVKEKFNGLIWRDPYRWSIPSQRRTNVATMKRQAKRRRNIRAKASKRKARS